MSPEEDLKQSLERSRHAEQVLEETKGLIDSGCFEKALEKLVELYDSGPHYLRFEICWQFQKLVRVYSPAVEVVRVRRDQLEKLIYLDRADLRVFHDWSRLNDILKEKLRALFVYNEIKDAGYSNETINDLLDDVWKDLLKDKRYSELSKYLEKLTRSILQNISEYDSISLFPSSVDDLENEQRYYRNNAAKNGPLVVELASALGAKTVAETLRQKLLELESSDRMFARLITAALAVEDNELAIELFHQAKSSLTESKMKKVDEAISRLPEAWKERL